MISLAAGVAVLVLIVVALIINLRRQYCSKKLNIQTQEIDLSDSTGSTDQAIVEPPPSYISLFGNHCTTTQHLESTPSSNLDTANASNEIIPSHTSMVRNCSPLISKEDIVLRQMQLQEDSQLQTGIHGAVTDVSYNYNKIIEDKTSTIHLPSYSDALVLLASTAKKQEEQAEPELNGDNK